MVATAEVMEGMIEKQDEKEVAKKSATIKRINAGIQNFVNSLLDPILDDENEWKAHVEREREEGKIKLGRFGYFRKNGQLITGPEMTVVGGMISRRRKHINDHIKSGVDGDPMEHSFEEVIDNCKQYHRKNLR